MELLQGVFLNSAVSEATEMLVVVADYDDGQHPFGPVRWRANAGDSGPVLPQAGDLCWIAEARGVDQAEWICVLWQPVP